MSNLKKNDIIEVEIIALSSEGQGIARVDGLVVFVKGALPGEHWRVRIMKIKSKLAYARAEVCLKASPERIEPLCPVFGQCGGCTYMHMSYEAELNAKLERVNDAFSRLGGLDLRAERILPSPKTESYRNKAVYTIAEREGRTVYGFYRSGTHDLIEIKRCYLQPESFDTIAAALCAFTNSVGLGIYDEASGRGGIRHLYLRCARDGKVMCTVTSSTGFGVHTEALIQALCSACPDISSVLLNVNKSRGNTVLDGDFYTLYGEEYLHDTLCGYDFSLSPRAFYQVNPEQAERLYDLACGFAEPRGKLCFDLYCGAGTISLRLAREAQSVIGCEIISDAVDNARDNAEKNAVNNVRFICADAAQAATTLSDEGLFPDVVVVDPPRKGMSEDAVNAVCDIAPNRIVYVSCDPATLARDLRRFESMGYRAEKAIAADMFPRTAHVETVCLLSKLKSDRRIN